MAPLELRPTTISCKFTTKILKHTPISDKNT